MLARHLTTILPEMTLAEAIDTTRIHRVAGRTGRRPAVVTTRPCGAPHQTISDVGLIGGGQVPTPGEVSRAHPGVRRLEARPARSGHGLAGLWQPLEEGQPATLLRGRHRLRWFCALSHTTHDDRGLQQVVIVPYYLRGDPSPSGVSTPSLHSVLGGLGVLFA